MGLAQAAWRQALEASQVRLFTAVRGREILITTLPIGLWRGLATSCPAGLPHLTFHGVPDYIGSLEAGLASRRVMPNISMTLREARFSGTAMLMMRSRPTSSKP